MRLNIAIFGTFLLFWQIFLGFLIDSNELYQVRAKKYQKNAALAFYRALFVKNWAKIREIPLYFEKSRIFLKKFAEFF